MFLKTELSAILLAVLVFGCSTTGQAGYDSRNDWEESIFSWDEKIDYSKPELYLDPGDISCISEENMREVDESINPEGIISSNLTIIDQLYQFMENAHNFDSFAGGGKLIARRTTDEIFLDKSLSGCHDWGLVLSALLRRYGIPAIYCDASSIAWAKEYVQNKNEGFQGHVFVEAYVDGRWVLLNSTRAEVIYDYDPMNPVLELHGKDSYYVMFKDVDPWGYGIYGLKDMINSMKHGASRIVNDYASYVPNGPPEKIDAVLFSDRASSRF